MPIKQLFVIHFDELMNPTLLSDSEIITKEEIEKDLELLEIIKLSEKQIAKRESIALDSSLTEEEMDKILMEKKYED